MADKLLRPEKRPQLSVAQKRVVNKAHVSAELGGGPSFSARSLGGGLDFHNSLRALWKKGYVTPAHSGKITEWTRWCFTDKFFRDFPSYRVMLPDTNPQPVIDEKTPDLAEVAQRVIDRRRQ